MTEHQFGCVCATILLSYDWGKDSPAKITNHIDQSNRGYNAVKMLSKEQLKRLHAYLEFHEIEKPDILIGYPAIFED